MRNTSWIFLSVLILLFVGCGDNGKKSIEASGTIEATNVIISSKVNGEVKELKVDEGSKVNKGDTLIMIDHELLDLQLNQAFANRDQALAQYNLLKNGARSEDIKQSEEMLKQAEVNSDLAEKDKARMENLFESKSITKKQYEDAIAKFDISQAQLNSAKENFKKIKNYARPEELKQAEANVRRTEAAADLYKKNIDDSYVISPISGIVVKKFIETGETVNQMSSLFKVSDLSKVELVIYVSEEELGLVKQGQKVDVTVDSFKDKIFNGTVVFISPEAEFTPKNIQTKDERTKLVFAIKIKIDNPNFELKSGMPADAVVKLKY